VTILTPERALPLISLYLRTQGRYLTYYASDGSGETYAPTRGMWHWMAAREVMPASARWSQGLIAHATSANLDVLSFLVQSVMQRTSRALQYRDVLHAALNRRQNMATAEEALAALDVILIMLMGAVDAAARAVDHALEMGNPGHVVGWQKTKWHKALEAKVPTLAATVDQDTENNAALTILRLLRNCIHGEALQFINVVESNPRQHRTVVGLPTDQQAPVIAAMERLGGTAVWGVDEVAPSRFFVDPGALTDRLMPLIFTFLDATMAELLIATNVSVREAPQAGHLAGLGDVMFDERARASIRWQLGL
jgi:hypothetical protein